MDGWITLERERHPLAQRGCVLLGAMIKRRRLEIAWTQRDLEWASGVSQSMISRLENGQLRGIRFGRLGRIIGAMNGLDPSAPRPAGPERFALLR